MIACRIPFGAAMLAMAMLAQPAAAQQCNVDTLVDDVLAALPSDATVPVSDDGSEPDAPTSVGTTTSLVDSPQKTGFFALALQQGLVERGDSGAISFSLAPFAWTSASNPPDFFDSNEEYERFERSRRFTGTLSLGGAGDALDSDGDGTAEEAAEADSLTDSVSLELQYRFWGTRDRREYAFADRSGFRTARAKFAAAQLAPRVFEMGENPTKAQCRELVAKIVADPAAAIELRAVEAAAQAQLDREIERFDTQWVWSVAANVVERDDYLGADRFGLALRGLKGIEEGEFLKFNFEYNEVDTLVEGTDDLRQLKLAAEYSRPIMAFLKQGDRQPRFSAALTAERYENAPADVPDSVAKLGLRWSFPLAKGVAVPLSITWANRVALLADEDDVVGHVGVTFDFDALLGGN